MCDCFPLTSSNHLEWQESQSPSAVTVFTAVKLTLILFAALFSPLSYILPTLVLTAVVFLLSHSLFSSALPSVSSGHEARSSKSHYSLPYSPQIVSEPDMRTGEEAAEYGAELRRIMRALGISNGNMQEGSMRCDVNVSGESLCGVLKGILFHEICASVSWMVSPTPFPLIPLDTHTRDPMLGGAVERRKTLDALPRRSSAKGTGGVRHQG